MKVLSDTASGHAHGKIILIGEHAVVHNEPAIAIPFTSANVEVTIKKQLGESTIESIYHTGKLTDTPKTLNNLIETLNAVCKHFGTTTENMHITIKSNIPAERGMGSSAAVATALVRALFNYFDAELTDELLNDFVTISEVIAHGNPSGLDAKVVSSNESVYFVKNQGAEFFKVELPGYLVVADTGQQGETGEAVMDVGKLVADVKTHAKSFITELGELTTQARNMIEEENIVGLGAILSEAQIRLKKLTVSNEALDLLVETARTHGALGAKLTGGGRGGCMIALADLPETAKKIADALLDVGAVNTWIHPLGAE